IPAQALWAVFLGLVLWLVLNRHPYGDNLRFCGDNDAAASAMGIPVGRTKVMLFILMGMVSAFSGMLVCAEMSSWWPTQGAGYMRLVFASVFIGGTSVYGGTGTIYGTCVGAVIIGIIEAGIVSAGISGLWIRMVYGVIIIFSVSVFALVEKKR
ncbi:MAG: ABC transporter permease, partial [Desulfobacterales bacterium]|nr:ABC transporter permease [Desulfobacterales bacterium]